MGMFDSEHKSHNPMDARTYIEERPPSPEPVLAVSPAPASEPTLVEEVKDSDLMFVALNLIKKRFNIPKKSKVEILAQIRSSLNSEQSESLAALERFVKNPSSSVADAGKTRSQIQEEWMRRHLKTKYPRKLKG
jgi:hypothetical protein